MLNHRKYPLLVASGASLLLVATFLAAAGDPPVDAPPMPGITPELLDQMTWLPGDLAALPPVTAPESNPQTPAKIELGKLLYFDTRLSRDGSFSCASCHDPAKGYGDGLALSRGFGGKTLGRHSPSTLNAAFNGPQFWGGRTDGLEAQAVGPIMAAGEMNMPSEEEVNNRLRAVPEYRRRFKSVFGREPNLEDVGRAIAAYERTLITVNSPFDRYVQGDKSALSHDQKAGLGLFIGKANCSACHSGSNFTDNKFYNLGVVDGAAATDEGRFVVTGDPADHGAFKTPTLRGVTLSAPYMHDGSLATLADVMEFYNRGGGSHDAKSPLMHELHLTETEQKQLIAFLGALVGDMPDPSPPTLPPSETATVNVSTDGERP